MRIKLFESYFDSYNEKDEMKRRIHLNVDDTLCVLNDKNIAPFIKFDNLDTELTITLKKGKPDTYLTYNDWASSNLYDIEMFSYDDVRDEMEHVIAYILDNSEFSYLSELKIDYLTGNLWDDNHIENQKYGPPGTRNLYDGIKSDAETTIDFVQSKVDYCKEIHYAHSDNNWIKRLSFKFKIKYK